MSVENFADPHNPVLDFAPPEGCFYCGKPLAGLVVHWHGTSQVSLHRECAQTLGCRLICDARHAELIERGKPIGVGIDHSLLAQIK